MMIPTFLGFTPQLTHGIISLVDLILTPPSQILHKNRKASDIVDASDHSIDVKDCKIFYPMMVMFFLVVNWSFRKLLAEPFGAWFLKSGRSENALKFSQAASECLFYSTFAYVGYLVLEDQGFAWPSENWWKDQPGLQSMTSSASVFYILYSARYFQALITCLLEKKKKDFKEMMIHHITTVILVSLSYYAGLVKVGIIIMVLMDIADPFLHTAKICKYKADVELADSKVRMAKEKKTNLSFLKRHAPAIWAMIADIIFAAFAIVFIITRIVMYGYVTWSTCVEAPIIMFGEGTNIISGTMISTSYGLCCLFVLIIGGLQVFWLNLILIATYKVVVKGEAADDTRSDTEGEE